MTRIPTVIAFGTEALKYFKIATDSGRPQDSHDGHNRVCYKMVYGVAPEEPARVALVILVPQELKQEIGAGEISTTSTPLQPLEISKPEAILERKKKRLRGMRESIFGTGKIYAHDREKHDGQVLSKSEIPFVLKHANTDGLSKPSDVNSHFYDPLIRSLSTYLMRRSLSKTSKPNQKHSVILKKTLAYSLDTDSSSPWHHVDHSTRTAVLEDVVQIALSLSQEANETKNWRRVPVKMCKADAAHAPARSNHTYAGNVNEMTSASRDARNLFLEGPTESCLAGNPPEADVPHLDNIKAPTTSTENTNSVSSSSDQQHLQVCSSVSTLNAVSRIFFLSSEEFQSLCDDVIHKQEYTNCLLLTVNGVAGIPADEGAGVSCVVSVISRGPQTECSCFTSSPQDRISVAHTDGGISSRKTRKGSISSLKNTIMRLSTSSVKPTEDSEVELKSGLQENSEADAVTSCSTTSVRTSCSDDDILYHWNETFTCFYEDAERHYIQFDILENLDDGTSSTSAREDNPRPRTSGCPSVGTASIPISGLKNDGKLISLPLLLDVSFLSDDASSLASARSTDGRNSSAELLPDPFSPVPDPFSPVPDPSSPVSDPFSAVPDPFPLVLDTTTAHVKITLEEQKKKFLTPLKKFRRLGRYRSAKKTRASLPLDSNSLRAAPSYRPSRNKHKITCSTETEIINPNNIDSSSFSKLLHGDTVMTRDAPEIDLTLESAHPTASDKAVGLPFHRICETGTSPPDDNESLISQEVGTLRLSCSFKINSSKKLLHSSTPRVVLSFVLSSEIKDRTLAALSTPFRGVVSPPLQPLLEQIQALSKLSPHEWVRIQLEELLKLLHPPTAQVRKCILQDEGNTRSLLACGFNGKGKCWAKGLCRNSDEVDGHKSYKMDTLYRNAGHVVDYGFILNLFHDLKVHSSSEMDEADAELVKRWLEFCLKILERLHSAFPVTGSETAAFQLANFTKLLDYLCGISDIIQRKERFDRLQMETSAERGYRQEEEDDETTDGFQRSPAEAHPPNLHIQEAKYGKQKRRTPLRDPDTSECHFVRSGSKERLVNTLAKLQHTWWLETLSVRTSMASSFSGCIPTDQDHDHSRSDGQAAATETRPTLGGHGGTHMTSDGDDGHTTAQEMVETMKDVCGNVLRYLMEVAHLVSPVFEKNLGISMFAITSAVITRRLHVWLQERLTDIRMKGKTPTECCQSDSDSSQAMQTPVPSDHKSSSWNQESSEMLLGTETTLRLLYATVREISRLTAMRAENVFDSSHDFLPRGKPNSSSWPSKLEPPPPLCAQYGNSLFQCANANIRGEILRETLQSSQTIVTSSSEDHFHAKNVRYDPTLPLCHSSCKSASNASDSTQSLASSTLLLYELKKWLYPVLVTTIETFVKRAENFLITDEHNDQLEGDCLASLSVSSGHLNSGACEGHASVADCLGAPQIFVENAESGQNYERDSNIRHSSNGLKNQRPKHEEKIVSASACYLRDTAGILIEFWTKLDWDDLHYYARSAQRTIQERLVHKEALSSSNLDGNTKDQVDNLKYRASTIHKKLLMQCRNSLKASSLPKDRTSLLNITQSIFKAGKAEAELVTLNKAVNNPISTVRNIIRSSVFLSPEPIRSKNESENKKLTIFRKYLQYPTILSTYPIMKLCKSGKPTMKISKNAKRKSRIKSSHVVSDIAKGESDNSNLQLTSSLGAMREEESYRLSPALRLEEDRHQLPPRLPGTEDDADFSRVSLQPESVNTTQCSACTTPARGPKDPNVVFVAELCRLCIEFSKRQHDKLLKFLTIESWKDHTCVEKVCFGLNNISEAMAIVGELSDALKLDDVTTLSVTSESLYSVRHIGYSTIKQLLKQHFQVVHGCVVKCCYDRSVLPFRYCILQRDYPILQQLLCRPFWSYYREKLRVIVDRAIAKQQILDFQDTPKMRTLAKLQREFHQLFREDNS